MDGEYRWGVRKILVGVLLVSVLSIYLSVLVMVCLLTSVTLREVQFTIMKYDTLGVMYMFPVSIEMLLV